MKYAWITKHRDSFPIAVMCDVLDVSTSGYYASLDREPSPRARRRARIDAAVRQVHAESHGIYGSGKIAKELAERDDLETACRNTVARGHAGNGPDKPRLQGLYADHHPGRSDEAAGPEHARPRLHGDPAESQVGDRHHLPADARRLGLPGRGARPVQPQGRRLVDRRLAGDAAGRRGLAAGDRSHGGRSAANCCITAIAAASTRATPTSRP